MKLSDALVRFARPLIDCLPPDPDIADFERMLHLGYLVWNSVVLEELGSPSPYLEQARALLERAEEPHRSVMLAVLADMESRKRKERHPDLRLIGEITVKRPRPDEFRVSASQVSPPGLPEPAIPDVWSQLYAEARRFHSLAPWHWMSTEEVFGIRDPATGEIGWCVVMGEGEELFGLAIYRGDTGFDTYRRTQSREIETDEALYGQDAFLLCFVDRADLSREELQRLHKLRRSFRGPGRWPQIQSHAAGRMPIALTTREAELMLFFLSEAIETIIALRDVRGWSMPDHEGRILVRTYRGRDRLSERVPPPPPVEIAVPEFDAVRAQRLRGELRPSEDLIECDLFPVPMVIEERKGRPYAPASFMMVDADSGLVLHTHLGTPDERARMAQAEFMAGLERLGTAPRAVVVCRPSVERVLAPVGEALGVPILLVDALPRIEEAQESLDGFLAGPGKQRRRRGRR